MQRTFDRTTQEALERVRNDAATVLRMAELNFREPREPWQVEYLAECQRRVIDANTALINLDLEL